MKDKPPRKRKPRTQLILSDDFKQHMDARMRSEEGKRALNDFAGIIADWATERGPIAAWGDYHPEASKRLYGYQLLVEWHDTLTGHHSLWCYCDLKRPTEWTIGRGRS
jgi:hypothetical protein